MRSRRIDWPALAAFAAVAFLIGLTLAAAANAHPGVSKRATRIWQVTNMAECHTWRCVYADRWRMRWVRTPAHWRTWVLRVEGCESGHNPRAVNTSGSGAAGSMQFMPGTWRAAGGTGSVLSASIFEQRVRAYRFAARHGVGHWVCR